MAWEDSDFILCDIGDSGSFHSGGNDMLRHIFKGHSGCVLRLESRGQGRSVGGDGRLLQMVRGSCRLEIWKPGLSLNHWSEV